MKTSIALVLLIATNCFSQTDSNILATGDWSEPVKDENGVGSTLRGRLLVYDDQVQSAANHARIYIEIQQIFTNGWYDPVEIFCFRTNLVFELKDDRGQSIRSVPGGRWGMVLKPYWVTVPCDGTVRIRADECMLGPKEEPDGLEILTHDKEWLISSNATNDFYLNCSFTSSTNHPSPLHYDTWRGTLNFPKVKISLKDIFGLDIFKPQSNSTGAQTLSRGLSNVPSIINGIGRTIIGKLLIPAAVTNLPNQAALPPSRWYVGFSNPATNPYFASGGLPEYVVSVTLYGFGREIPAQMAVDGTFRLEDVTPGRWWFLADFLRFPMGGGEGKTIATAGRSVVVPEMPGGRSDESLDLGTVEPVLAHAPQIGEAAPPLEVKTVDGGTFNLAGHRGQYVLLDFEPLTWDARTSQSVQATWAAFGKNDRLAVLTLLVPPTCSYLNSTYEECPWPQSHLGDLPWYELKRLRAGFGLQCDRSIKPDPNLPAVFLVGLDGKIVASELHGASIKSAIAEAMVKK